MSVEPGSTAHLLRCPGQLRQLPPEHVDEAVSASASPDERPARWVWEGAMDGPGLAALLRSAMVLGVVPCEVAAQPYRARVVHVWYDAGQGTVVAELAGRPEPVA